MSGRQNSALPGLTTYIDKDEGKLNMELELNLQITIQRESRAAVNGRAKISSWYHREATNVYSGRQGGGRRNGKTSEYSLENTKHGLEFRGTEILFHIHPPLLNFW